MKLLDELPALSLESRAEAIEQLVRNSSPGVRGRALRMGAAVLSDDRVVEYLRKGDDGVLRNAGLEMLKMRGPKGFTLAVELLKDRDEDVVLQSVLALDHFKDPRAMEPLRSVMDHPDPNVIQAVIVAMGHLGDARAIPDLLPFLEADPWLQMAAVQALGDLRSPVAVRPLTRLLTDMMLGPMAAEALARIGGAQAFRSLAKHWLDFHADLDAESTLGLLAHILEGLNRAAPSLKGLHESLVAHLDSAEEGVRSAAARCLVAIGPTTWDERALALVAETHTDSSILPSCLNRRRDLLDYLLRQQGVLASWGFLLSARYPKDVPVKTLVSSLSKVPPLDSLDAIVKALEKIRHPDVATGLLDLYLGLPLEYRAALVPLLSTHRRPVKNALDQRQDLAGTSLLVLNALLGAAAREVVEDVVSLDHQQRVKVLSQITERHDVLALLPWMEWLDERPELYATLTAQVAVKGELRDLLPALRHLLEKGPSPTLVRTVGELGDRESVPILLNLLRSDAAGMTPLLLESLGRVGGPEAREALRRATSSHEAKNVRIAYKALSLCATREDDTFFRGAVTHTDWYVRLSCAEVLGRFARPENMAALAQLAADPVPIVSQRALSFLEA